MENGRNPSWFAGPAFPFLAGRSQVEHSFDSIATPFSYFLWPEGGGGGGGGSNQRVHHRGHRKRNSISAAPHRIRIEKEKRKKKKKKKKRGKKVMHQFIPVLNISSKKLMFLLLPSAPSVSRNYTNIFMYIFMSISCCRCCRRRMPPYPDSADREKHPETSRNIQKNPEKSKKRERER